MGTEAQSSPFVEQSFDTYSDNLRKISKLWIEEGRRKSLPQRPPIEDAAGRPFVPRKLSLTQTLNNSVHWTFVNMRDRLARHLGIRRKSSPIQNHDLIASSVTRHQLWNLTLLLTALAIGAVALLLRL